ncbi:hypothetical protein EAO77_19015 [Streptomyces sp. t39]|nr:hypothetical protein EAO77_19015 [Streptomyces sp. t39]
MPPPEIPGTPWPDRRPPCRTVVGLFPRPDAVSGWDGDDPDAVPDPPPTWARVVEIGTPCDGR